MIQLSSAINATECDVLNADIMVKRATMRGAAIAETDALRTRILAVLADTQARLRAIGDDANAMNPPPDGSVTGV